MMTGSSGCPEEPMSLIEEMLESWLLCPPCGHREKAAICTPGRQPPPESHLGADPQLPVSRTVRNKMLAVSAAQSVVFLLSEPNRLRHFRCSPEKGVRGLSPLRLNFYHPPNQGEKRKLMGGDH